MTALHSGIGDYLRLQGRINWVSFNSKIKTSLASLFLCELIEITLKNISCGIANSSQYLTSGLIPAHFKDKTVVFLHQPSRWLAKRKRFKSRGCWLKTHDWQSKHTTAGQKDLKYDCSLLVFIWKPLTLKKDLLPSWDSIHQQRDSKSENKNCVKGQRNIADVRVWTWPRAPYICIQNWLLRSNRLQKVTSASAGPEPSTLEFKVSG